MPQRTPSKDDWPPAPGKAFAHSEDFCQMLLDLVQSLADKYPHMDFSDAVASVFSWFDGRLKKDPQFVNGVTDLGRRRFRTRGAFRAYLRQAVWNAARLAERKRKKRERLKALSADRPIVLRGLGPEENLRLSTLVESLEEPHQTVFVKYFFEEEDLQAVADQCGRTRQEVMRFYEEAVDQIALRAALQLKRPH